MKKILVLFILVTFAFSVGVKPDNKVEMFLNNYKKAMESEGFGFIRYINKYFDKNCTISYDIYDKKINLNKTEFIIKSKENIYTQSKRIFNLELKEIKTNKNGIITVITTNKGYLKGNQIIFTLKNKGEEYKILKIKEIVRFK